MAEPQAPLRVLVCGADHLALAVSLARAGCRVTLFEPDIHDRTRLSDVLARRGRSLPGGLHLTGDPARVEGADVVLGESPLPPGLAINDAPVLWLDWASADGTALHLTELPGRQALLERIGPDTAGGHVAALGRMLGARVVGLASGTTPPSQRLMAVLSAEIEALALGGATPVEVDEALTASGFSIGPFEAQDLEGIDTCLVARRAVFARHPGPPELPLFARAVAEGRLGRKVGVGWYRYPGGGGKVEDPLVEDLAIEEARFAGISRSVLDPEAVRVRILSVLQEEAARIAEDTVLTRAEIDRIAQLALGAPAGAVP